MHKSGQTQSDHLFNQFTIYAIELQKKYEKDLKEISSRINNIMVAAIMISKQNKENREKIKDLFNRFYIVHIEQMKQFNAEIDAQNAEILKKYGLTVNTLPFYVDHVEQHPMTFEQAKKKYLEESEKNEK